MRDTLIAAYLDMLGGRDRVGPILLLDVERCVDMIMLAKTARSDLAAGRTTINDVVKLENAADRSQRRLNLPTAGTTAAPMGLHDIVARHAADGDG